MLAYACALVERVRAEVATLRSDRKGVTALEYALMAGLVSLAIVGGAAALGTSVNTMFGNIGTALSGVTVP
jgi:pilus assembly protein Flp/PilA